MVAGGLVDAPMISSIEWKLSKRITRTTVTPKVLTNFPSRASLVPTIHWSVLMEPPAWKVTYFWLKDQHICGWEIASWNYDWTLWFIINYKVVHWSKTLNQKKTLQTLPVTWFSIIFQCIPNKKKTEADTLITLINMNRPPPPTRIQRS